MSRPNLSADLRQQVLERARAQCEYCRFPQRFALAPHVIDHIIAYKHGGATTLDNLALACPLCNQHKGSDIASLDPLTGQLTALFHPRRDVWREHFTLTGNRLTPLTASGRVTAALL